MKVKEVVFKRCLKGYEIRHEVIDGSDHGGEDFIMKSAFTHDGHYIGSTKDAYYLCVKRGLTKLQKVLPTHCVCSIGFNEAEQKWYGWSHRAICGFGLGDRVFEEEFGNDQTLFVKHGKKKIKKLIDAKVAASRFAGSVS